MFVLGFAGDYNQLAFPVSALPPPQNYADLALFRVRHGYPLAAFRAGHSFSSVAASAIITGLNPALSAANMASASASQ
jgi:hypothetical protein